MLVALHEAAAERSPCKIQPLQDPDPSHQNHQDTDKAAYPSHYRVEHTTHHSPHRIAPPRNMRIDLILSELLAYCRQYVRYTVNEYIGLFLNTPNAAAEMARNHGLLSRREYLLLTTDQDFGPRIHSPQSLDRYIVSSCPFRRPGYRALSPAFPDACTLKRHVVRLQPLEGHYCRCPGPGCSDV
jgi:hypothetical protein